MEKYVAKKFFEENLKRYAPTDPLYETYVENKGRERRRKRDVPPGISARDAKILKSVNKRAHHLDKSFSLCGMCFGRTFVIGLIPGGGVAADAALNYLLVVRKAQQAGIPPWTAASERPAGGGQQMKDEWRTGSGSLPLFLK